MLTSSFFSSPHIRATLASTFDTHFGYLNSRPTTAHFQKGVDSCASLDMTLMSLHAFLGNRKINGGKFHRETRELLCPVGKASYTPQLPSRRISLMPLVFRSFVAVQAPALPSSPLAEAGSRSEWLRVWAFRCDPRKTSASLGCIFARVPFWEGTRQQGKITFRG